MNPPAPSIAESRGAVAHIGKIMYARFRCKGVIADKGRYVAILEPVKQDGTLADPESDPAYYIDELALIEGAQVKAELEAGK